MSHGWVVERARGDAATFHRREVSVASARSLWLLHVSRPAVVLGSTQPIGAVDESMAAAHGIEVVRRRSGGSAVLVEPGRLVWADLVIGRDDPLWENDIGRSPWWVGELWVAALRNVGIEAVMHRGPMRRGEYGDRICFAGLGPGEVLVKGRKVVGLSQRRTREVARFQTAALVQWDPSLLAALCAISPLGGETDPLLMAAATGIDRTVAELEDALVAVLPD